MTPGRSGLLTIEAGRAVAALLVVLFHASAVIFPTSAYWSGPVFGRFFDFGFAGVEFFFVLSGFIIAHVHADDIGRPDRAARFARRRLLRIYPLYWLTCVGVMALLVLQIRMGARITLPAVTLQSVLLIGTEPSPPVLAVAWTLFHEMLFYFVFGLWVVSRRLGLAISLLWLSAIIVGPARLAFLPAYVASPRNLLFLFGIAAWWLSRSDHGRWSISGAVTLAVAGSLGFVGLGIEKVYLGALAEIPRSLLFGVASAAAITGLVNLERRRPVAVPRVLVSLGAASYAIYLCHFPVLNWVHKLAGIAGLARLLPTTPAFVLVVAATVGIGVVYHRAVEQPLRRRLERLWPGRARLA